MKTDIVGSGTDHVELEIQLRHRRPDASGPGVRGDWRRSWSGSIGPGTPKESRCLSLDVTPEEAVLVLAFRELSCDETRTSFVDTLHAYVAGE
jgi:hypothetical protein